MFYKAEKDMQGEYTGSDGARYSVLVVRRVRNAQGVNVGFEEFPSLDAALAAWGLVRTPLPTNVVPQ